MDRERDTQARPPTWRDRARSGETAPADQPVEPTPSSEAEPAEDPTQATEPATGPAAPGEAEDARAVEGRTTGDRRVTDEAVEEERRIEARRQRDRESRERRQYVLQRVTLGVDYVFYLLYGLLLVRFILSLLGAAETAGFVAFIHGMTNPFYAPFSGIVARPAVNGGILDFPLVIALLAYVLLHIAARGLLRLLAGDRAVP